SGWVARIRSPGREPSTASTVNEAPVADASANETACAMFGATPYRTTSSSDASSAAPAVLRTAAGQRRCDVRISRATSKQVRGGHESGARVRDFGGQPRQDEK